MGLTSFSVERRVKKIAFARYWCLDTKCHVVDSKGIVGLIGIAFVIASPLTWYLVSKWLTNFTEHIAIGTWPFVAQDFCVTIACLTISWLSFNAASSNPTTALRNEIGNRSLCFYSAFIAFSGCAIKNSSGNWRQAE